MPGRLREAPRLAPLAASGSESCRAHHSSKKSRFCSIAASFPLVAVVPRVVERGMPENRPARADQREHEARPIEPSIAERAVVLSSILVLDIQSVSSLNGPSAANSRKTMQSTRLRTFLNEIKIAYRKSV
jgi:hypothetical protein